MIEPMPRSYLPCPICEERQRTDNMKSHLYCQHAKQNIHRWVSKEVFEEAITKKIPLIWKMAEIPRGKTYEDISYKEKIGDFCICLVCKDSRYYKADCHIKSDVAGFFKHHLKTECMTRWNSVAERYGEVATAEDNNVITRPTVGLIDEEKVRNRILIEQCTSEIEKLTKKLAAAEASVLDYKGRWEYVLEKMRTG